MCGNRGLFEAYRVFALVAMILTFVMPRKAEPKNKEPEVVSAKWAK